MIYADKLTAALGGCEILGFEVNSELDMVEAIRSGLSAQVIEYFIEKHHLTRPEVETLIIPRSTLALRKKHKESLTSAESEHVVRIARIIALAKEVFVDENKASHWLRRPNRILRDQAPLAFLDTEEGARLIESTLGQIAHGVIN